MTNLSDFLKVKKVRCVDGVAKITTGKVYDVIGLDETCVHVTDDDGEEACYWYCRFEPVLDSAENPLQGVELTPEFEAAEPVLADNSVNIQDIGTDILDTNADIKDTPKFEVGDKVYYSTDKEIYTISEIDSENSGLAYLSQNDDDWDTNAILKFCCHATQENYEMLCKLYPHIEFEPPPKPLSGDDIVKAMLKKGIKNVLCLWGNGDKIIIDRLSYKGGLMSTNCNIVGGLTPIDWYTGEPLTESILND